MIEGQVHAKLDAMTPAQLDGWLSGLSDFALSMRSDPAAELADAHGG